MSWCCPGLTGSRLSSSQCSGCCSSLAVSRESAGPGQHQGTVSASCRQHSITAAHCSLSCTSGKVEQCTCQGGFKNSSCGRSTVAPPQSYSSLCMRALSQEDGFLPFLVSCMLPETSRDSRASGMIALAPLFACSRAAATVEPEAWVLSSLISSMLHEACRGCCVSGKVALATFRCYAVCACLAKLLLHALSQEYGSLSAVVSSMLHAACRGCYASQQLAPCSCKVGCGRHSRTGSSTWWSALTHTQGLGCMNCSKLQAVAFVCSPLSDTRLTQAGAAVRLESWLLCSCQGGCGRQSRTGSSTGGLL